MRKLATIEKILEKKLIEGADKIEAVRVRDWWVVSKKDEYQINDLCVYFEIDSFLPVNPKYEFLLRGSSPKKMIVDGKEIEGIRLKTIKLRGQISQGLVMTIKAFEEELSLLEVGTDVTEILGIHKYEIPIPVELAGKMKGYFPGFIPRTDEERIQNMAEVLSSYFVTEKLDGTSTTFYKKNGVFGVCSRNIELLEGDTTQWKIAKQYNLAEKLPDNFAVQCELIGENIQANPLKQKGQEIYCFNVYNIESGIFLNYQDFLGFCDSIGIKTVPIIEENYSLPNSVEELLSFAEGKSKLNGDAEREGVVIRPRVEMRYNGQRLSFKAISNKYLLKERD